MKIRNKKLIILVVIVILPLSFIIKTNAQDYCGSASCTDAPGISLTPEIKQRIEQNKPIYENAAKSVGIPWQMIAAVHFREAGCDPTRSTVSGEKLGTRNPDDGQTYYTLEQAAKRTAEKLKSLVKAVYGFDLNESPTDDVLGYAFLAYNRGYMYRNGLNANGRPCPNQNEARNTPYDKSPYVVNFIDENHQNMNWNGCIDSGMTHKDSNLGALAVYKILQAENCSGNWTTRNGWEDWLEDPKVKIKPYTNRPQAFDQSRKITPQIVVMHYTGNVNDKAENIWNYFNSGGGPDEAFCSFLIDKDGTIIQAAPANVRQVCVAGYNNISINIEGAGNFEAVMPPSEETQANSWLLEKLIKKYNLKPCDVWAHGELNPRTRSDPGRNFARIMWDSLNGREIQWQNHPKCTPRPPIPGK